MTSVQRYSAKSLGIGPHPIFRTIEESTNCFMLSIKEGAYG
jgi:hypothetical protein